MRIRDLHIDGFGHYSDANVGPFNAPVVILYGANEAGKSTLLEFMRTTLFGFPRTNKDYHYPALAGGRHGGRITVLDDSGNRFVIERHAGKKGGPVSVRDDNGQEHGDSVLATLLGNASGDVFETIFAFSLNELASDQILKNSDVNGQIYSAGLGASKLPEAFKSLASRKDEIYLPSGRKQKIAVLVSRLKEIDAELGKIKGNAEDYAQLVRSRHDIDGNLESRTRERSELDASKRQLETLVKAWEDWVQLVDVEEKLEQLPRLDDFPEDAAQRLEKVLDRVGAAEQEQKDSARHLERAHELAAEIVEHEEIMSDHESIAELVHRRGAYDNSISDLPDRKVELTILEGELAGRLANLGPGWDEPRLKSIDSSMETKHEITLWKNRLAEKAENARIAQTNWTQTQVILKQLQESKTEAQARLDLSNQPDLTKSEIDDRHAAIRASRSKLADYERKRDNHAQLEGQVATLVLQIPKNANASSQSGLLSSLIWILLGAAFAVTGLMFGESPQFVGIVAGLVFILWGVFSFAKRSGNKESKVDPAAPLRIQVSKASQAKAQSLNTLQKTASVLNLNSLDSSALDEMEAELEAIQSVETARRARAEVLSQAQNDLERQHRRVNDAEESAKEARSQLAAQKDQWREWLRDRDFPDQFAPETMVEFWGLVDAALEQSKRVDGARRRVEAIEVDIQQYRELVEPLAQKHSIDVSQDPRANVAAIAATLSSRFTTAQKAIDQRSQNRKAEAESQHQDEKRRANLTTAQNDLQQLLELGTANDPEEFRRKVTQCHLRAALERKHEEHRRNLLLLSGGGELLDQFRAELSQTTHEQIHHRLPELKNEIDALEMQQNQLREDRGRADSQIDHLASEERSSSLRLQRNDLLEQLREQAEEWSRLRIAEELLSRARDRFQKERQPDVIRHAESFFTTVTGNRYKRLYAPMGENTITVEDDKGVAKQPNQLSRGTREQLYLALRFGLIREFGKHAEPLPVIVDEVLVNFDPVRARRAAEAFNALSETNQILVFTCHPTMRDIFVDACDNAQVLNVDSFLGRSWSGTQPGAVSTD